MQSSLAKQLAERIKREGALTFYEWMEQALYNESAGYYMRDDAQIWGRKGDYRTSPETSELFAATFADYFAYSYEQLGRPASFHIVECGAGDGVFAEGVLSSLKLNFPDVFAATTYVVDEIAVHRFAAIKERLGSFATKVEFANLKSIGFLNTAVVFSNELLDSFPVHRLTKRDGDLLELYVTVNSVGEFDWTTGPISNQNVHDIYRETGIELRESQVIEVSPDVLRFLGLVAQMLQRGYLITVDYGAETTELYNHPDRLHGTLRAYSRHRFAEVLENPGEQDITAHVNWTQVKSIGATHGFETISFDQQDRFLLKAGILDQLERRLTLMPDEAKKARLTTAAREMILPGGMASHFQVLVQARL